MKHIILLFLLPLTLQAQDLKSQLFAGLNIRGYDTDIGRTVSPGAEIGYRVYNEGETPFFLDFKGQYSKVDHQQAYTDNRLERSLAGGSVGVGLHLKRIAWLSINGGYLYNLQNTDEFGGIGYASAAGEIRIPLGDWSIGLVAEAGRTFQDLYDPDNAAQKHNWTAFAGLGIRMQYNFNVIDKTRQQKADEREY